MTNNEEKVHVRAYVKDDGTKVKEHYRGLPDGMSDASTETDNDNTILYGKIEKSLPTRAENLSKEPMYLDEMHTLLDAREHAENTAKKSKEYAAKFIDKVERAQLNGNWREVRKSFEELQAVHQEQHIQHKELLMKLVYTNNQKEYSKLYKMYIAQRERLLDKDYNMNVIKWAIDNKNITMMKQHAKEYYNTYNEVYNYYKNITNPIRTVMHGHPNFQKTSIGLVMNFSGEDAHALWKIATEDISTSEQYINKNGRFVKSISDLPPNLQKIVRSKVQEQLHQNDTFGIMFHSNSSLSKSIENSFKFRKFLNENKKNILKSSIVANKSINTYPNWNSGLALGHIDIIDLRLDSDLNIRAHILDTYDFNENDPNPAVEWARNVQEHRLLKNYFTITEISIPFAKWIYLLDF